MPALATRTLDAEIRQLPLRKCVWIKASILLFANLLSCTIRITSFLLCERFLWWKSQFSIIFQLFLQEDSRKTEGEQEGNSPGDNSWLSQPLGMVLRGWEGELENVTMITECSSAGHAGLLVCERFYLLGKASEFLVLWRYLHQFTA